MESNEEKLHKMIIQSKINDTKDVMKRKAIEIDKQKLDREARARETKLPSYVPSISNIPAPGRSPMHNDDHTPTYTKYVPPEYLDPTYDSLLQRYGCKSGLRPAWHFM